MDFLTSVKRNTIFKDSLYGYGLRAWQGTSGLACQKAKLSSWIEKFRLLYSNTGQKRERNRAG